MAEFGWAYLSGAVTGQGPKESIQYLKAENGELSGSNTFTFATGSNTLFVSGSVIVSGTISAHTLDVIQTTKVEISSSGGTNFGDDATDTHVFTGSVSIVSGGLRQHYYKLTGATHTVAAYDSIIGVSSSAYVAIQLPAAATAGFGRVLIIKDEWSSTRSSANEIAVSASGGETIDHAATYCISGDSAALTLYSDGTSKWFIY